MDGFACHYLTDAFSASHTRTPRSSIEAVLGQEGARLRADRLEKWLADEIMFAVQRSPSGILEWLGATVGAPFKLVRAKAREKVKPVVPALSFGDVVGLVVHDWEGAHGPLVDVAGQRLRTVGDDGLMPVLKTFAKPLTDSQLKADTAQQEGRQGRGAHVRRRDAGGAGERRRPRAGLRAGAQEAQAQGHPRHADGQGRAVRLRALHPQGRSGREAARGRPDAEVGLPHGRRAARGREDPRGAPRSAKKVAEPFEDTIKHLDASKAVKDQIQLAVVNPLKSGDVHQIGTWVKSVIGYSPETIERRLQYGKDELRHDLVDLRGGAH